MLQKELVLHTEHIKPARPAFAACFDSGLTDELVKATAELKSL